MNDIKQLSVFSCVCCVCIGHDVIGLAKTGSGKTFSFLWPMLTHITDQPQMQLGDGPIALILSPTRELAEQIYRHAKKFGRIFNIRSCAVFGGEGISVMNSN